MGWDICHTVCMQLQQLQNDQYVSCLYWMQVGSVNATTFSKAFHEWRYCNFGMRKLKHSPLFECPCCTPVQHSVHVDGNKKLYRYSKVPRYNFAYLHCKWKESIWPLILFLQKEVILMLAHSSSFDEFLLPINVGAQASNTMENL